jgi:hypothetical protein
MLKEFSEAESSTAIPMKTFPRYLITWISLFVAHAALASSDALVTAVYSKASNGYQRQKLADGSFKREYYALAKGVYNPGVGADRSIDGVKFPQVAKLVAQFLALENYYLAPDAKSADLLLTITWGKTVPFNDSTYRTNSDAFFSSANTVADANAAVKASENAHEQQRTPDGIQIPARSVRDAAQNQFEGEMLKMAAFGDARLQATQANARLLGYVDELNERDTPSRFGGSGEAYNDLWDDLENERYYVIVAAYDFRAMAEKKGADPKMLWSTRVSIRAQGNRFNETLAAMLKRAAPYFGENSGRLIRRYEPNTKVELGDLKTVGYEPKANVEKAEKP